MPAGYAVHAGAIDRQTAEGLMAAGRARPAEATEALREAVALREAMYRIFAAVAAGQEPPADDLEHLNRALARALPRRRLKARPGGFDWAWADEDAAVWERPLWPILASAAELLTSDELALVRRCADDECGWLFVDMSRNRSRRWCAMEDCGNRAKARRHYYIPATSGHRPSRARHAGPTPRRCRRPAVRACDAQKG